MKIEVRIGYEAMCRSHRSASYKGQFHETVTLEIAETDATSAPVATETPHGKQTRWYGGRHYLPRHDQDRIEGKHGLTTDEALEILQDGSLYGLNYGYGCFERRQRPSLFVADKYVEFDHRERDRAIAEAKLCLDCILLIDGEIWVECAEPYLIVEDFGSEVSHDIPGGGSSSRPNHRALDWLFHAKVRRADDPAAARSIKVLIPESITLQPERETIIDAAKFLLEDYSYFYLWDIHPRVFSALRDVHAVYQCRTRGEMDCEALVEPILRLVDEMERFEGVDRISSPHRLAGYRKAVDRWLDRDLSVTDILPAHTLARRL
ncbi:hypothetical protein OIU34_21820 [Pararhizobium sp. BT-229]|uniref:hypothetical protein n=1 Tax=Pararhizobium sp. BT-229 TaxID=2986923 RepID=UPI0021F7C06F|nr:hypothetical protein [Pararhizobium sp. BT-229]MCV9964532.1 hypothetical protein [Pararhizobium sp. BT-229]